MRTQPSVDRARAFVDDIEAIPATLDLVAASSTSDAVQGAIDRLGCAGELPARVVLTGLGSSRFAALQAEAAFRAAGVDNVVVVPAPAFDARWASRRAGPGSTLTIAISNGGTTPEVVAAAARARAGGRVLAITRELASPLAAEAQAVIPLPIGGPERSGIAITSFVATIGVLLRVAPVLGRASGAADGPDAHGAAAAAAAAAAARAILETRSTWLTPAMPVIERAEEVAVLAPWSLLGVSEQAALLLREGPRRTAAAFETAEWLHTGVYTALPGTVVALAGGSDADGEVERTARGRGAHLLRLPVADAELPVEDWSTVALAAITAPALLAAEWWLTTSRDVAADDRPR